MSELIATEVGELVALRPGVCSVTSSGGEVGLVGWPHAESLGVLSTGQLAALRRLAGHPRHTGDLIARGEGDQTDQAQTDEADVEPLLEQLRAGGWLSVTVTYRGESLYTLVPLRPPPPRPDEVDAGLVLSRFALLRRHREGMVLESPRAWCDVRIQDNAALAVLGGLHDAASGHWLAPAAMRRMLADLQWAGMAVPPDDDEQTALRLRQWSPHELWFHQRSRLGYRGGFGAGFGGTFWARGSFDPPGARPDRFSETPIDLYRPDMAALRRRDPTLTTVLEDRHSVRKHDDSRPITLDQLGELLYRCARTRLVRTLDGFEYTSRPYPSGGSAYELELYPVVRLVAGLAPGMYHYDSLEHQLHLVAQPAHRAVKRLLRVAETGAAGGGRPQVLVVLAARVGRLMWKYESMPYALILKHVGVLCQTMYCVATAMDLAACALGSGDASAFTEATGLDPVVECSVGEFILGAHPATASRWAATP